MKFDFGGYATKNDLKCSDGRIIRKNAFKDCDGMVVPLVWQHLHEDPENCLGHATLRNKDDGVYAYCSFNSTPKAQLAKELVEHKDINSLSIYANGLKSKKTAAGSEVIHGMIREVSLVLAGANPGARIDNLSFQHSDGEYDEIEEEAFIKTGETLSHGVDDEDDQEEEISDDEDVKHADGSSPDVASIYNSMTPAQQEVCNFLVGKALDESAAVSHSDTNDDDTDDDDNKEPEVPMKHNIFDKPGESGGATGAESETLTHDDMVAIFSDAKRDGSLKNSVLEHGITNVDVLFPDAQVNSPVPAQITRRMEWVSKVLDGCHHSPFSRVKSRAFDLTADEARAKGYIKGKAKVEEQISALKRVVTPTTVYKKQKMDRDDIIDITDFDVVSYLKGEMRVMLDEEIARAVLIGDGRASDSDDKINPTNIIPIWTDSEVYAIHKLIPTAANATNSQKALDFIDMVIRGRKDYKGTSSPDLYIGADMLVDIRLLKDSQGYRLYKTDADIAADMRVNSIIEVGQIDSASRSVTTGTDTVTRKLAGIMVYLDDYTIGADKGGAVSMFDDFDIDYNQQKYLIETRCSGALTMPSSAVVFEFVPAV